MPPKTYPVPQHLQNKGRTTTGLLTYWHSAALNAVPPIYLKSLHSFWSHAWSTSCSASIRHGARWEPSPWPCHVLSSQALSAKSHLPMSSCTLPGTYWASEISTANSSKAGLNSDRPKQGLINSLCCWKKQHRNTSRNPTSKVFAFASDMALPVLLDIAETNTNYVTNVQKIPIQPRNTVSFFVHLT